MNKNKNVFKQFIFNDKILIVISVILAVFVWTVTSLNIGTDETKTITINVPINLGDEFSEQVGMQYYSLQDSVDISVTVTGAKYVIGQVDKEDLSVKFDTSNVNRIGAQSVPILVTNKSKTKDFTVQSTYPSSIDAYFDVEDTKTLDVKLNLDDYDNILKSGYVFGEPVFSENKVLVTGPKTYVERVEKALLNFSFGDSTELTEPYKTECAISVDGVGVDASYLTISDIENTTEIIDSILVTVPVLKEVELPVIAQFENSPSGIKDSDIEVSYSKKKLSAGILDSADITSAVVGKINFNQLKPGVNSFDFNVTTLQGITVLDDIEKVKVKVTISDDYTVYEIPIDKSSVNIENVEKGKKLSVNKFSNSVVSVVAPKNTEISLSDLSIKCDASEQNADDSYNLNITVKNNKAWVYSTYTVTLK